MPHTEALKHTNGFRDYKMPPEGFWADALDFVMGKIDRNRRVFADGRYPAATSQGNVYSAIGNTDWTSSFWTGQLWLAYEMSGRPEYRISAEAQISDYARRVQERIQTETHDLGFLYTLSCVAAFRLTANSIARDVAISAADLLMERFHPKAGIIQAWGNLDDPALRGRIIIDCAMNLPLLYWASEQTGVSRYRDAAECHLSRANKYLIRPDSSTYHTYYFDTESGIPLRGTTAQGYADDSCWARGQAWGMLGLALSYRWTGDKTLIEKARLLTRYFLNRLPEDLVSYWDLVFTEGNEERDSSAAAIAACALLEWSRLLPDSDKDKLIYFNAGHAIMESLVRGYTSRGFEVSNGLLLHGVYNKPSGLGVDECVLWGDYFFMEGLVRIMKDWKPYW